MGCAVLWRGVLSWIPTLIVLYGLLREREEEERMNEIKAVNICIFVVWGLGNAAVDTGMGLMATVNMKPLQIPAWKHANGPGSKRWHIL